MKTRTEGLRCQGAHPLVLVDGEGGYLVSVWLDSLSSESLNRPHRTFLYGTLRVQIQTELNICYFVQFKPYLFAVRMRGFYVRLLRASEVYTLSGLFWVMKYFDTPYAKIVDS